MAGAYRPLSLEDALRFRAAERATVLAGGTDFMVKRGRLTADARPALYIGHLTELRQISRGGDTLRVGAACTLAELLASPLLPDFVKLPIGDMASPAVRNIATIGGNICNASPAADTLPMLYALDAALCLRSASGCETVPLKDFILGPGMTGLGDTRLLTEIIIPSGPGWRCAWRKVGMRRANSLAKLSVYMLADRQAEVLRDIRVALGAVAPTVVRCREAEKEILESARGPVADRTGNAAERYGALLQPISDARSSAEYRRAAVLRLLAQMLGEEACA